MRPGWLISGSLLVGVSLGACGLLEVGPASRISTIEPISLRVEVVELGPLMPERVAFPSSAPIAEFMPGDRVRFEVEVVDTDGLALADEELDSLWFLCAAGPCQSDEFGLRDPVYEEPCEELDEWTMDSRCRLGGGRGSIEFVAPPLGEETVEFWQLASYVVVAWNGQRAEHCWATRIGTEMVAPDCGFLTFVGRVGPRWSGLAYAKSIGMHSAVPVDRLPAPVFLQQANRVPLIDAIEIEVVGKPEIQALTPIDGIVGPVAVDPGDRVRLTVIADTGQAPAQSYFFPLSESYDTFILFLEHSWIRVSTAGPIVYEYPFGEVLFGDDTVPVDFPFELQVTESGEPGTARAVLVVADGRGGEDVVRVEFELQ